MHDAPALPRPGTRSLHGLGLPPPTELIRIPQVLRSSDEVLERARAARHDPRWMLAQWAHRAVEIGGGLLDHIERDGLEGLALLGRHARVAWWRTKRATRRFISAQRQADSVTQRIFARIDTARGRIQASLDARAARRGLDAPLPLRRVSSTHDDLDRAKTYVLAPFGTETGSARLGTDTGSARLGTDTGSARSDLTDQVRTSQIVAECQDA
ncbi:MAG: hypothetical protein RMA76_39925 [Deltaproteobacteria bacterium]